MTLRGTDPETYITEHTLVYEEYPGGLRYLSDVLEREGDEGLREPLDVALVHRCQRLRVGVRRVWSYEYSQTLLSAYNSK